MDIMISVNPPYADMILSGYKPFEFRKRVLNCTNKECPSDKIKAYIYETKNMGGKGAVVGEVLISGAYALHYGNTNIDIEISQDLTRNRLLCVKNMYLHWCKLKRITPDLNKGWYKNDRFENYQKEIGFLSDSHPLCNFALVLTLPTKYPVLSPLSEYLSTKNVPLVRPPQNMFRVSKINR